MRDFIVMSLDGALSDKYIEIGFIQVITCLGWEKWGKSGFVRGVPKYWSYWLNSHLNVVLLPNDEKILVRSLKMNSWKFSIKEKKIYSMLRN